MKDFKVLYLTRDYKFRSDAYSIYFPFFRALKRTGRVDFIEIDTVSKYGHPYEGKVLRGMRFDPIIKFNANVINERYDFIASDNYFPFMFNDWSGIKIPRIVILEDLHGYCPDYLKMIGNRIGYNAIFTRYFDAFEENYDVNVSTFHLPHCISSEIHRDFGYRKEIDFLMTGAYSGCYILRDRVIEKLKWKPYFRRVERIPNRYMAWPFGVEYSKLLNRARISLGTTSTYKYPIAKFFEIPACRTALMGNYIPELGRLGFIPNYNYIHIEMDSDIEGIVRYWLKNKDRLKRVTDRGFSFVHREHNADVRAHQFLKYCEEI